MPAKKWVVVVVTGSLHDAIKGTMDIFVYGWFATEAHAEAYRLKMFGQHNEQSRVVALSPTR